MNKLKIVYCGTPDFALSCLEMLTNHPLVEVLGVVSMPDRPAGRGQKLQSPPVAEFAKSHGLPLIQTENINREEDWIQNLSQTGIDAFIVLAFAQFLGQKLLSLPRLGCFNIHTSLLPKYRGAAPIQHALLNGDASTGVSIQKMVKKMDAGNLVASMSVPISETENGGQLYTRLKFASALTLNNFIFKLKDQSFIEEIQDESMVSFAPPLQKTDGHLLFARATATVLERKVRALAPWPGTYFFMNGKRIKVLDVSFSSLSVVPGNLDISRQELLVGCREGTLRLRHIQPEGKKACDDRQFINGLKNQQITEFKLT